MSVLTDDEIRALLGGATPGPWAVVSPGNHVGMREISGPALCCRGFTIATDVDADRARAIEADARLIAAAPDAFAEVLRLREALREADLQLAYLDERQPTGTTPAIRARIAAALKGAAE